MADPVDEVGELGLDDGPSRLGDAVPSFIDESLQRDEGFCVVSKLKVRLANIEEDLPRRDDRVGSLELDQCRRIVGFVVEGHPVREVRPGVG